VHYHGHAILRDQNIEFERIDTLIDGVAEGRKRILRQPRASAAMPVNQNAP